MDGSECGSGRARAITDLSRLCVHTITTKPWPLARAIDEYRRAGVAGITVWRQALEAPGVNEAARMLRESGLRVVSLCRGGFFPALTEAARQTAIDDNRRAVDEAAAIGAPLIVLVCGAVPGMPLEEGRAQSAEGIAAVLPHAQAAGVKLSIEPLHPMYADARSGAAIWTMPPGPLSTSAADSICGGCDGEAARNGPSALVGMII